MFFRILGKLKLLSNVDFCSSVVGIGTIIADIIDCRMIAEFVITSSPASLPLFDNKGVFSLITSVEIHGAYRDEDDEDLDDPDVRAYSLMPLSEAIVFFSRDTRELS